jgi:hypothetical protein
LLDRENDLKGKDGFPGNPVAIDERRVMPAFLPALLRTMRR